MNAVDKNDKTPLGLAKLRCMKADFDDKTEMVENIKELLVALEDRGAVIDWRKAPK